MDGTMLLAVGGHWWVFFFPLRLMVFFFFFPPYGFYFFFGEDELLSFLVDAHFSSLLQVFFFKIVNGCSRDSLGLFLRFALGYAGLRTWLFNTQSYVFQSE